MINRHFANNLLTVTKAIATNLIATVSPSLFLKLTQQTGRGDAEETVEEISSYFLRCFQDYCTHLNLKNEDEITNWLETRDILEYGPGDILGIALLMYAYGANSITCIDRFPLSKLSPKNIEVYHNLINSLPTKQQKRAKTAFNQNGQPESGFKEDSIVYRVTKDGLSHQTAKFDFIISRAVLEHVNNLDKTAADVKNALKPEGISIHQIDLRSHGLDRYQEFDFLAWPTFLYKLMYSQKGFPNRHRVNIYKDHFLKNGLTISSLTPEETLTSDKIASVRPRLASEFRDIPDDELSWKSFWITLKNN